MAVNHLGLDCVLAYDDDMEAGTWATPSWTEIAYAKDVSGDLSKALADVSTRAANGWRQRVGTLKEGTFTFRYKHVDGDDVFDDLWDSFVNDTRFIAFFADGPVATAGTEGLKFWAVVSKMSPDQNLEDAMFWNVEIVIADATSAQTPTYITVAS